MYSKVLQRIYYTIPYTYVVNVGGSAPMGPPGWPWCTP